MTADNLARFVSEYGDWGNPCMRAYGVPGLWEMHLEHCARCRAVQDNWDREKAAKERAEFEAGVDQMISAYDAFLVDQAIEEFNAWQDGENSDD